MALLKDKKKEDTGKMELSEIVLDMLIENEPEEEIQKTLESTGLKPGEAEKVLKKIKKDYYGFMSQRLDERVEELFEENSEELINKFNEKIKNRLEETQLKIDLRFTEMQDSLEEKLSEIEEQLHLNEEMNRDLKDKTVMGYNQLKKDIKSIEFSGPLQGVTSASLMLIGVMAIVYSLSAIPHLPNLLQNPLSVSLLPLSIVVISIVAGLVLFIFGFNILRRIKRSRVDVFEE